MIIAVDFDGTLCEEAYPEIGVANKPLIKALIKLKNKGNELILWTCRNGSLLKDAVKWCKQQGLKFDKVNENLTRVLKFYKGVDSRKLSYDILIDDKNINPAELDFVPSNEIIERITGENNEPRIMIPLLGLVSDNGQQYLTLGVDNKFFACSYRPENTRLKQSFTAKELENVPSVFKQFIPAPVFEVERI
ncbi:hypothetical protein [Liquorilactobacillus mali]|uniref:Uncharacterized protein n=1 Tax=Liquorilactobacillus mali KCTC 3596 = DSM 20444 TaxID=1046596 RepID=A0A0R2DZN5_9LACO|nr:hypothetical protein [Liquorilactobacillus mali]KRN09407.1 hypothetical protein FD00_GL001130 [Liquorilactobacillus mali KCTC 3596 = DSM 20444]